MQVVYAVFLVMTLPSFLSMTARVGNLMKAVGRYAAGDTSYEEYILSEFLETTIDLAELVMYMAMFEFAMGKVLGGSGGTGSESGSGGENGSGSGSESGSGSGTGESGGGSGSSGVGEGGKTIDDIIHNLSETTNGKGVARNFESTGGFDQTIKDFDSLNPIDVKEIQTQYGTGKVGKLRDGTIVVARPGSTTGGATLEIRVSNSKVYKIRY